MPQAPIHELGWQPDMPDWRDLTVHTARVAGMIVDLAPLTNRPSKIDWSEFCPNTDPDIEVPSSTQVCVDLLEYCERRVTGQPVRLSSRFVHSTAARYAQTHGGNGLSLRLVWKSIVRLGAPTANVWPGPVAPATPDPDAFAYSMARSYSDLIYVRLDGRNQTTSATLEIIRCFLAAGFTFVLGIPHFSSISADGEIGFPTRYDTAHGGQAVLAIGYDDDYRVRSDRGCFLVRGYWGKDWGDHGHGWLPYSYVRKQLAIDFWTVLNPQWLATGEFLRPVR